MKQSNYIVRILEPENGWLTQVSDVEIQDRAFSKKVYLGVNDEVENWKEITDEEYNAYQLELEKHNEELEKEMN